MSKTRIIKRQRNGSDDIKSEYQLDYQRSKPNRFATSYQSGSRVVVLDPDVAKVFTTPESVNDVLRALLATMPRKKNRPK